MKDEKPPVFKASDLLGTTVGAEIVNEPRDGSHDTGVYLSPHYRNDMGAAVQIVDENGDVVGVVQYASMEEAEIRRALMKAALSTATGIINGFDFAEREAGFGSPDETPTDDNAEAE